MWDEGQSFPSFVAESRPIGQTPPPLAAHGPRHAVPPKPPSPLGRLGCRDLDREGGIPHHLHEAAALYRRSPTRARSRNRPLPIHHGDERAQGELGLLHSGRQRQVQLE